MKKDIHKLFDPKTGKLIEELDYNDPNVGTWSAKEAEDAGLCDINRPHAPEEKLLSDNDDDICEEEVWKTFSEVLEELGYEEET